MKQVNQRFIDMVDELIELTDCDPELKDGLAWLDKTDKYGKDLNFYEKVFECLYQHDIRTKAEEWYKTEVNK